MLLLIKKIILQTIENDEIAGIKKHRKKQPRGCGDPTPIKCIVLGIVLITCI